ncbi:MAG TPA: serine protein kinase PrkA, partial [Polyangiaceae bacterium]|nr:serine protein kinase PrkA [Polyangiaceae bacterium]
LRALEHYSTQDEGALYRFHWIFPNRKMSRGSIGFGGSDPAQDLESFAFLDDEEIDARLVIEVRDHPLFLIPGERRRPILDELWSDAGAPGQPPEWLYAGELGHKNKQIFEALLAQYKGSLAEVLKHVQVERYFISRRYRVGAVTLGPEMSVDAGERQVTADRSLAALPTSLQATTLFEAYGELVEAAGGVLEFSDLLKRPIDAFRYLQLTLETGEVSLQQQTVFTNVVMIGSANDIHMAAFREHPEYQSFRGRLELVRVPYLRSYLDEQAIYDTQIVPQLRRHVAPHCTRTVSEFAVLTRMRRPDASAYPKNLGDVVESLSAVEKMILYAEGKAPERLKSDERKLLRANIDLIWNETDSSIEYEGRVGVSPRQVRTLLLDAAQSEEYDCVSPFAVLKGIEELCKRTSEFEWLKLKPLSGGYHDHHAFRQIVRQRLMDRIETDMREASALIHAEQYGELFRRYLNHVSAWVKGEKMRNSVTGKDENPDERLMREVESLLGVEGEPREHRDGIISMVAAWVIEHPGEPPRPDEVFPVHVARMQIAAFGKLRKPFATLLQNVFRLLRDEGKGLDAQARREASEMVERLKQVGYAESSAADAASALLRDRYTDLVS